MRRRGNTAARLRSATRAFTLLELLIAIGVVLLLASIIVVAFKQAVGAANRADTSNALRQMMLGYNVYATDNRQMMLPGFVSAATQSALGLKTKVNGQLLDPEDAESYVWRLAPYLDGEWSPMFADYRKNSLTEALASEVEQGIYGPASASDPQLGASRIPSIGLNSIYVGGDDANGASAIRDRSPWGPDAGNKLAATRLSEVRNASRLVVFAPTEYWDGGMPYSSTTFGDVRFGAPELRAPRIDGEDQWTIAAGSLVPEQAGGSFGDFNGWPVVRWGQDTLPVAHLDASVSNESIVALFEDDRFWSPFATGY